MQLELRYFLIFTWLMPTIVYSTDGTASDGRRERWIALGKRMSVGEGETGVKIDTWNLTHTISSSTTVAEVGYGADKGMKINWIVAAARKMNGFISVEDGGLEKSYVKIRYVSENGAPDELFVFVESYKPGPLILDDNVARADNVAIVYNDIRNWTAET